MYPVKKFKTQIIGLFTVLFVLWILLYFIPDVLVSLFNTLLGNLLLMVIVLCAYVTHKYVGILVGIVFVVMYRFVQLSKPSKEGFSFSSANDFLKIQHTINPQKVFDMNILSSQASQAELDYFNDYGVWPWSTQTIELYKSAIRENPYVRTEEKDAVHYARTIYNEAAILRVLYNQSKEGHWLIHGLYLKDPKGNPYEELPSGFGVFPYVSGLQEDRTYDKIQCSMKDPDNPTLERIQYTGKDGIFGSQLEKRSLLDFNVLESIIPGFVFQDKPCNPCNALRSDPDYSCKFSVTMKE